MALYSESLYGAEFDSLYGGAVTSIDQHGKDGEARLRSHFDSTDWETLTGIFAARMQPIEQLVQELFTIWRLGFSAGARIDDIGSRLDFPRQGAADPEYNTRLLCQALVIGGLDEHPRTTLLGFLAVVRCLVPTGNVTYSETYPKSFQVILEDIVLDDIPTIEKLLSKSVPATYNGSIYFADSTDFTVDDTTATVATGGGGTADASGTIDVGAPLAFYLGL